LKISFYFPFPSFYGSFPTSCPFQFLGEDPFGLLSSSILSRRPSLLILCPFIHFIMFYPLLISSSSRFILLFYSLFSFLGSYILLNIFLSKISRASSSFSVTVHVSAPYHTIGLISVLYSRILAALDKSQLLKTLIVAK
jgi:hypothetical protein